MPLVLNSSGGGSVTVAAPSTASNVTLTAPAVNASIITNKTPGTILQVVQVVKTDVFSASTNGSWITVTGLAATITPTSSTNKILVMLDMKGGNNTSTVITGRLTRNGTAVYVGNSGLGFQASTSQNFFSGDIRNVASMVATYLDSPNTTSSVTYQAQINGDNSGQVIWVNTNGRQNTSVDSITASSITLMEVVA